MLIGIRFVRVCLVIACVATTSCAQERSNNEFRHWTTSDGTRSSVQLKLLEATSDTGRLEREDNGKEITFSIAELSNADQSYLHENMSSTETAIIASSESGQETTNTNPDWPCFRSPHRNGVAADANIPLKWDSQTNIRWKADLPGPGSSSPVLWNTRAYVTCYSGYGLSKESPGEVADLVRHLVCLDAATGQQLWKKDLPSTRTVPQYKQWIPHHGYASSTPAVGDHGIYVSLGTSGFFAFSHEGERRWHHLRIV